VVLFVPLARFSFVTAYAIWLILNVALLCWIPCVLRKRLPALGKAPLYLWLLACFAFYPIFMALIQGQDSILLLFLYCLAYEALERRSELAAGGWLALGLYKYHLVLPFVGSLWRRNKLIAGFLTAAGGILLFTEGDDKRRWRRTALQLVPYFLLMGAYWVGHVQRIPKDYFAADWVCLRVSAVTINAPVS